MECSKRYLCWSAAAGAVSLIEQVMSFEPPKRVSQAHWRCWDADWGMSCQETRPCASDEQATTSRVEFQIKLFSPRVSQTLTPPHTETVQTWSIIWWPSAGVSAAVPQPPDLIPCFGCFGQQHPQSQALLMLLRPVACKCSWPLRGTSL